MPLPINVISLVLLGEGMDESYGDHSDSNCYSDHSLTGSPAFLDDGKTSSSFSFIRAYPESGHVYPRAEEATGSMLASLIRNLGTFIPAIQALFSARRRLCRLNSLMIAL